MDHIRRRLRFEKLTERNFQFFKNLMCTDNIAGQCYCLSHRVEPKDLELDSAAAAKMQSLVEKRKVHGLVAFDNNSPVAWVGIEPFPSLIGHDVFEMLLDNERHGPFTDKDWAIHCLFVTPDLRGEGLTSTLVDHAIQYAVDRGAQQVLAFPPPPERAATMNAYDKYSGTPELYLAKAFVLQGLLSPNTSLMVKKLTSQRPKLTVEGPSV